jgi:hypothetical protein
MCSVFFGISMPFFVGGNSGCLSRQGRATVKTLAAADNETKTGGLNPPKLFIPPWIGVLANGD